MHDVWRRIETALRAQAPDLLARLPGGATGEAVAAAEARLGFALPDDLRESYAVHDGTGGAGILPQYEYGLVNAVSQLALAEALGERDVWVRLLGRGEFAGNEARPAGPIKPEWWNRRWLPLTTNGGGDHLCSDLDPAPGGAAGQVIDFGHGSGPRAVVAGSWREFLEGFAADLEAGRVRFDASGELQVVE